MKTIYAVLVFLCIASQAFAGGASNAWNGPWQFITPFEKANLLNQAIAIDIAENGGFSSTSNYYQQQDCNVDGACMNGNAVSIGSNIVINGGEGNVATATNDGNVSSQNNNGEGEINHNTNNTDNNGG